MLWKYPDEPQHIFHISQLEGKVGNPLVKLKLVKKLSI